MSDDGEGSKLTPLFDGSMRRLLLVATNTEELKRYTDVFQAEGLNGKGGSALQMADNWIDLVASRSQTLLQFNSIFAAVLVLADPQVKSSWTVIALTLILAASLALLANIFVFLGPPEHYADGKTEFQWSVRNAALRSLILNCSVVVSGFVTLLFAAALVSLHLAGG